MTGLVPADPPNAGDSRRITAAREHAMARIRDSDSRCFRREAFRHELGSVVRSASPVLQAMLEIEGLTLDDAVRMIEPQPGWPSRPRLSQRDLSHFARRQCDAGHHVASPNPLGLSTGPWPGYVVDRAGEGWLRVEVVDHSLEIIGRIGPMVFDTRFGLFRIELMCDLPHTALNGCIGSLVEEIVHHPAFAGRDWRVVAVEDGMPFHDGPVLIIGTGSIAYRVPWVQSDLE